MCVCVFVLMCIYPCTCYILLIQTACSCFSSATSVLCPASLQWNSLYKDTSLCSPINQAVDVHCLQYSVCVCVRDPKTVQGRTWNTMGLPPHNITGDWAKVKRETQRSHPQQGGEPVRGGRGLDGEWDKQEDAERQSSRYTEQRAFSMFHIRTVASGWNLSSFMRYFQSRVDPMSPSPSD